jgi:hypothetical protein
MHFRQDAEIYTVLYLIFIVGEVQTFLSASLLELI